MDLTGRRFGRLVVSPEPSGRVGYVVCDCDCGNTAVIRASSLTKSKNPTQSCGCVRKEIVSKIGKKTIKSNSERIIATNMRYNTNFQIIESTTPNSRNKSGYKGVWYDPKRGVYEAYIGLHKKKICLGRFKHIDDAINARKAAEEELFAPLIAAKRADLHITNH